MSTDLTPIDALTDAYHLKITTVAQPPGAPVLTLSLLVHPNFMGGAVSGSGTLKNSGTVGLPGLVSGLNGHASILGGVEFIPLHGTYSHPPAEFVAPFAVQLVLDTPFALSGKGTARWGIGGRLGHAVQMEWTKTK